MLWMSRSGFGGVKDNKPSGEEHKHTKECETDPKSKAKDIHKDSSHKTSPDGTHETKTKDHIHTPNCGHDSKEKTQTSQKVWSADEPGHTGKTGDKAASLKKDGECKTGAPKKEEKKPESPVKGHDSEGTTAKKKHPEENHKKDKMKKDESSSEEEGHKKDNKNKDKKDKKEDKAHKPDTKGKH